MNKRITALDILRGMTICGMILVNNPGGGEENAYAPLLHADWIGLTPTDLVFPFFMFIMGITTYLSLRRYEFRWSGACAMKITRRALLLWATGLAITALIMLVRGKDDIPGNIRILGVLPRLGICYGIAALIAISVRHKYLPWLIAGLFIVYYIILETCNGYAHDATNIIAIVDDMVLGHNHVYRADSPDPEGLLSTLPAIGHVLTGFCVGKLLMREDTMDGKIEKLFLTGSMMMLAGALLAYACPISKKLWTPTFSLVTCGMASTILAMLTWVIDKKGYEGRVTTFFRVFGVNPLALYVISDLLLIPFSILPVEGSETIQDMTFNAFSTFMPLQMASLGWTIIYILINWALGYVLYTKKVFIKI